MQHRVSNTGEDSQCFVQARIREKWQLQRKIQFNVQFFFPFNFVWCPSVIQNLNGLIKKTSIFCVSFMWYMYLKFYEVLWVLFAK